jgi:hypothetical protein
MGLPREAMEVLWRVQPPSCRRPSTKWSTRYGSLEAYFREGLRLRPGRARAPAHLTAPRLSGRRRRHPSFRPPRRPPTQLPGGTDRSAVAGSRTLHAGRPKGCDPKQQRSPRCPTRNNPATGCPARTRTGLAGHRTASARRAGFRPRHRRLSRPRTAATTPEAATKGHAHGPVTASQDTAATARQDRRHQRPQPDLVAPSA